MPRKPGQLAATSLLIALAGTPLTTLAEVNFVTDEFKVMMRSGEDNKYRIIKQISSGDQVTVLSRNRESGYSKIQYGDTVGYVLTHQLMEQPSAREQLADMKKRLAELQQAPDQLSGKLTQLRGEHERLKKSYQELSDRFKRLSIDHESIKRVSADAISTLAERDQLRDQVIDLTRNLEESRQQIRELSNSEKTHWFLVGSGVLFGGVLLGLFLPHIRFRQKHTDWDTL